MHSSSPADTSLRSIARATAILRTLASDPQADWRLSALADAVGLNERSTRRIAQALCAEGLVQVTPLGYSLGVQAWLMGEAATERHSLTTHGRDCLLRIAEVTGDVSILSVPFGRTARVVGREEGDHPILPMNLKVKVTRPLGCGAHSMALLAAMPDAAVERVIEEDEAARQSFPSFTKDRLRSLTATTRANGFAESAGDIVAGMSALAVAILDQSGRPIAALSCLAISERLTGKRREAALCSLVEQGDALATRIGGRRFAPIKAAKAASRNQ
ncbi:IclR family transcriptional regulator C-terminal domain-containing protein [Fodinicurvata sp. EGI_FJ10296]|uniref:IclR family transcriptional regulator n=1 Tax=Fodinicurvata sp. EGI_FJ10296 TaxID=3231908 RepID=UPI003454736E